MGRGETAGLPRCCGQRWAFPESGTEPFRALLPRVLDPPVSAPLLCLFVYPLLSFSKEERLLLVKASCESFFFFWHLI